MQSALVVFLRGCNVGGNKTFRPTVLAEQLKNYDVVSIEDRFLFGLYRRQMKAISYLGAIDRFFGVRAKTRNWNTIAAIIKVLSTTSTYDR